MRSHEYIPDKTGFSLFFIDGILLSVWYIELKFYERIILFHSLIQAGISSVADPEGVQGVPLNPLPVTCF